MPYNMYTHSLAFGIVSNDVKLTKTESGAYDSLDFNSNAYMWDNPEARDPRWRVKRIRGGVGVDESCDPNASGTQMKSTESEYDVGHGWRAIFPRVNSHTGVTSSSCYTTNRNESFFSPVALYNLKLPLHNSALMQADCSIPDWATNLERDCHERINCPSLRNADASVHVYGQYGVIPAWSRCIDTGSELVWITQGSSGSNQTPSIYIEGASTYQYEEAGNICTLYPNGNTAVAKASVAYVHTYDSNSNAVVNDVIGFSQGMNGITNWVPDEGRGSKFLYAFVLPYTDTNEVSYDLAWDAEIELPTSHLYPRGFLTSDRKIIAASHKKVTPSGNFPSERRVILDLEAKTFSYVDGSNGPLVWDRQILKTMGGRRMAFYPTEDEYPSDKVRACLVDNGTATLTHDTIIPGMLLVTRDRLMIDPLPVGDGDGIPQATNRYLVHGDFDCSMRSYSTSLVRSADLRIDPHGTPGWLKYWMPDTTKRSFSQSPHSQRVSAFIADVSNVDRVAEGQTPLIAPDKVCWVIPWTHSVVSSPNAYMLVDLQVPEEGIVTLHSHGTCFFDIYGPGGVGRLLNLAAPSQHATLSVRMKPGIYTLRVGQLYSEQYGSWVWSDPSGIFLIDCGYWVI